MKSTFWMELSLSDIMLQDIISSSLDAYKALKSYGADGYNYTAAFGQDQVKKAFLSGSANPYTEGAAWEGTFNIPVSLPSLIQLLLRM
jgi:hypothetical protein